MNTASDCPRGFSSPACLVSACTTECEREDVVAPEAQVRRLFEIRQPVPALHDDIVLRLDHEGRGRISLDFAHPFFGGAENSTSGTLDIPTAEALRDALDCLIEEQKRNHVHVSMTTTRF